MLEIALLENIQREDLNAIEEAQAYKHMMDELSLTQEQLADGSANRVRMWPIRCVY